MTILTRFVSSAATVSAAFALFLTVPASADDTIRMLTPTWPGFAPVLVANDLGYFEEEGITVILNFDDDRANVLAAMTRGDIESDMRTVGEHQGAPRDENTPGIIIGTIDESLGGDGVVVDGTIESVADMKGKTVAVEPNIPARLLLQLELKKAGLTLDDVEIKQIATADTIAVFSDSSIPIVATYEPFMSQTVKNLPDRNPRILISSKDYPGVVIDIITAREDDLAANPEKYKKFLRGIYRAIDYYKTNPDDFIKLAAPHYNLSEAEVKEILDTSLVYTDYATSLEYIGEPGKPGKLYDIFDTVMQLNLDYGAADIKLDPEKEIDSSVIPGLF